MLRIFIITIVITLSGVEIHANDLMNNGKTYYSGGDFRKAVNSFELFVRSDPGSAEGYEWLGKAYYSLGDNEFASDLQMLEKAAAAFRKALSLNPGNWGLHFYLGMTYLCLDDRTAAMKEYELLKSSNKELANRLLERIRGHSFPPVYRVVHEKDSAVTHVAILGNQVLVPVILAKDGNEVLATLLLDTGASVTSINSDVAARLRIDTGQTQKTTGQVAGGGLLDVRRTRVSYITVGPHTRTGMDVVIVEHKGPPVPFEGLLGMNFLRDLRYAVDFQNRTINWNP
jgi:tetratricopeptide (TPR) repeat protein